MSRTIDDVYKKLKEVLEGIAALEESIESINRKQDKATKDIMEKIDSEVANLKYELEND